MTRSDTQGIHITALMSGIGVAVAGYNVPRIETWYLHFRLDLLLAFMVFGAAVEVFVSYFVLRRKTLPTLPWVTLLGGYMFVLGSWVFQKPLLLPENKIRIAVTAFTPNASGEPFTNRLLIALREARDRGLPIEVVEIGSVITGMGDTEKEAFAVRLGRTLPVSAHVVVWGKVVADAPPYHVDANVTIANNPFGAKSSNRRDAPWLDLTSVEGKDHPRLWPRTTPIGQRAATLEALMSRQTITVEEVVSFLGGLALLEAGRYEAARASIPEDTRSFNLKYLRAVALLEHGVEQMANWFQDHGDFIVHVPAPAAVVEPVQQSITEFDALLSPGGFLAAREAKGIAWYAYYSRARAKEFLLSRQTIAAETDLLELRDIYAHLVRAARHSGDSIAEMRAFLELGSYELATVDSLSRRPKALQLFRDLRHALDSRRYPPELQALAYLRMGQLCSDHTLGLPKRCAPDAYTAAARSFRSQSAHLGEAAVHGARGRYYGSTLSDPERGAAAYRQALDAGARSRYANAGTRSEDAWFYLLNLSEVHDGHIPARIAPDVYDYVVRNTYRGRPLRLRGGGDLFLQSELMQLKLGICERSPDAACWRAVLQHADALLGGIVGLDDSRVARFSATRAFAMWQLAKLGVARPYDEIDSEMLRALSYNNKAGGVPGVVHTISRVYRDRLSTAREASALDARLIARIRAECTTRGGSYLVAPGDSLARNVLVVFPRDPAAAPTRCSRTSLALGFTPLAESIPIALEQER